jgi:tripeptide aminopeptidase
MEDRFRYDRERMLNNLTEMIRIDSETFSEGEMTAYLQKWFADRGYAPVRDEAGKTCGSNGDNVVVHIPGTMPGEPICFNAHQDTVKPGKGIRPVLEGDILKSDGTTILGADCKAGIAILLEALENLREKNIPHRDLYYLFTIGEEIGQTGAHAVTKELVPCRSVFPLDDAGKPHSIDVLGPCCWGVTATFRGKAAHASINPEKGVSAIQMMAEAVAKIPLGRVDENTRANIGLVSGGRSNGIVPEEAEFSGSVYGFDEESPRRHIERMRAICEETADRYGGTVSFHAEKRIPLYKQEQDWFIFQCCRDAYRKEGIEPELTVSGGAGDCNVLNELGYECGGLATGMHNCHGLDEYLDLTEWELAYRIVMRMMTDGFQRND